MKLKKSTRNLILCFLFVLMGYIFYLLMGSIAENKKIQQEEKMAQAAEIAAEEANENAISDEQVGDTEVDTENAVSTINSTPTEIPTWDTSESEGVDMYAKEENTVVETVEEIRSYATPVPKRIATPVDGIVILEEIVY